MIQVIGFFLLSPPPKTQITPPLIRASEGYPLPSPLGGTNPDEVNTLRKISPKIFGKLNLLVLVIWAWIGQPQVLY